jgi:hypothetical protein
MLTRWSFSYIQILCNFTTCRTLKVSSVRYLCSNYWKMRCRHLFEYPADTHVFPIREISVRIRILGYVRFQFGSGSADPWDFGMDPDPWDFGMDPAPWDFGIDPDPRIREISVWLRIRRSVRFQYGFGSADPFKTNYESCSGLFYHVTIRYRQGLVFFFLIIFIVSKPFIFPFRGI